MSAQKMPAGRNRSYDRSVVTGLSVTDLRDLKGQVAALAVALQAQTAHSLGDGLTRYESEYLTHTIAAADTLKWRRRALGRLAPWADLPIDGEWRPVALEIYRRYTESTASHIVSTLARVLNLAEDWGWRSGKHRIADLARVRSKIKDRVLAPAEMLALEKAIGRLERTSERIESAFPCLRLLVLRGLRVSDACSLGWANLSSDCGTLILAKSKVGRMPYELGTTAAKLLASLPRSSRWVFPGDEPDSHVTKRTVQALMTEACRLAKIEGASVHSLRHTWASLAIASGVPIDAVSKALGHASIRTTLRYLHTNRDAVTAACNTVQDRISQWLKR